ncbi:MAG: n-acetylglutamate synthase [Alphaproteobacteria bacterium]
MTRAANYDGRVFKSIANTPNGEIGGETRFHYRQAGDRVWASYEGGGVTAGHLIATVAADGSLDMRYHHVSPAGALMTGVCRSRLEILPDGRYRLHETWQWTSGDLSRGTSVVEEISR